MWDNIITAFRNIYREYKTSKKPSNKTVTLMWENINKLCLSTNFDNFYKKNEDCQDVSQTVIEIFLKQLQEGKFKFWEDTLVENKENNARIKSYIYRVIQNELMRGDKFNNIKNNFRRHIERALESLVNEKKLIKNEKGKYYSPEFENNYIENCSEIEIDYMGNIYNKNGTINNDSIKELILIFFNEYLENCAVSSSYVKRIISDAVYPVMIPDIDSLERKVGNDGEDAEIELKDTIEYQDETVTQDTETEQLTDIWIARARKFYVNEEEFRRDARLFLGKFYERKTLRELEAIYKIKKTTIDNYIKRFIAAMKIHVDVFMQEWEEKYKNVFEYKLAREIGLILEEE